MTRLLLAALLAALSLPAFAAEPSPAASMTDRKFVTELVGPPTGPARAGDPLEAKTHEVSLLLRCPVCQGSAIADSPSATAINMKQEVRDLLAAGYDEEQVLRYFELAYGEFVRLQPKAEGIRLLVWLIPAALLLLGIVLLTRALRRLSATQGAPTETKPIDPELARYVEEARALAGQRSDAK